MPLILHLYKINKMNLLGPVKNIMTKEIETLHPKDHLNKADKLFALNRFHHLPVVESGRLKGILSKSDLLFFKSGYNKSVDSEEESLRLKATSVEDIMTTKMATLQPDDKINVALEIFKENLFHAIPIVEKEKLVGIVSTYDIINQIADDKNITNEYL